MFFFISTCFAFVDFVWWYVMHVHSREGLKGERNRKVKFKSVNGSLDAERLARSKSKKCVIDEDAHCLIRFFSRVWVL